MADIPSILLGNSAARNSGNGDQLIRYSLLSLLVSREEEEECCCALANQPVVAPKVSTAKEEKPPDRLTPSDFNYVGLKFGSPPSKVESSARLAVQTDGQR